MAFWKREDMGNWDAFAEEEESVSKDFGLQVKPYYVIPPNKQERHSHLALTGMASIWHLVNFYVDQIENGDPANDAGREILQRCALGLIHAALCFGSTIKKDLALISTAK